VGGRKASRRWFYVTLGVAAAALTTGIGFAQTFVAQSDAGTLLGAYAETAVATNNGKYGTAWSATVTAHQKVPGSLPTGDLFVVTNPNNFDGNLLVTLYLTNTGALASDFRYLNLDVGVYYNSANSATPTWTLLSDEYLSLQDATVTFTVPAADFYDSGGGYGELSISVDGGDYLPINSGPFSIDTYVKVVPGQGNV
jgi:hypothetical protein